MLAALLLVCAQTTTAANVDASFSSEFLFPPADRQTHAPGLVECPNGDLLASWYSDSEGTDTDAAIWGARKRSGETGWSKPFLLADRRGFPDCNTCMFIDARSQLWLFYPTIIGESWESCLMNYLVSSRFEGAGPPTWERQGVILLKPKDFQAEALKILGDGQLRVPRGAKGDSETQKAKLGDSLYQRLGWAPRCKPTVLPSGRIILPLYTDTFAISIMAISDDGGSEWYASAPLIGFGNIQPTVLRRNNGSLVAYMRENGRRGRIRVSESSDDGLNWSSISESELPNPGAGIDAVRLRNGHWALIYNDSRSSRATLAVSISEDEGKTWKYSRHLEKHEAGRYHYPAMIQGRDGQLHAIYACFVAPPPGTPPGPNGQVPQFISKGIKHCQFDEGWVRLASSNAR